MTDDVFKVISVTFCEYVSQDATGKNHNLGIYPLEMRFDAPTPFLPPIFICVVLQPFSQETSFSVEFRDPKERLIIKATGRISYADPVPEHTVVTANFQTPAIPFPGEGRYSVSISDESGRLLHTQPLYVSVGRSRVGPVNFAGNVEVGSDFSTSREAEGLMPPH